MPGGSGQLDAAVPPGPRDGPLHPSPQESGQIQDLEIPRNSANTPMCSFTKIDDTSSDAKTLRTELSMSYLSSDVLDRSSDGFAIVGKDDKLSSKDDHQHPPVVRSEVGQVGPDATSRGWLGVGGYVKPRMATLNPNWLLEAQTGLIIPSREFHR